MEAKVMDEKQKQKEYDRLQAFLKAIIPESWDKFDLRAKWDSSLSYLENKDAIIDDIKVFSDYKGASLKEQVEQQKAREQKFQDERNREIEKEIFKYNEKRNSLFINNKGTEKYYAGIYRAIGKMATGHSNLAFIKGRGGIGKSHNIRKALIQNGMRDKEDFIELSGDVTEAYLYRLLFENNGKIIWFRDVVKILRGMNSINLLKSASETEEQRLLTKSNYSKEQDDLPDRFNWKGSMIFDYNEISGSELKEDFEALTTRGDFVEISLCIEDIKEVMLMICRDDWQKEVTNYLIDNYEFNGRNLLNMRTQWKAFQTYKWANEHGKDWRIELREELKNSISKVRGMLYSLIGLHAVRTTELKKLLLKYGVVGTLRTADRKIQDWLVMDELFRVSAEERDYYISINQAVIKRF